MAATMAPVSSKVLSFRVMAARMTASCHSKGIAEVPHPLVPDRPGSRRENGAPVRRWYSGSVSSGPKTSVTRSSRKNGISSRIAVSDRSVVNRMDQSGDYVADMVAAAGNRAALVAIVVGRPDAQADAGRACTRRICRISIIGVNMRPYWGKRGQKSVTSTMAPWDRSSGSRAPPSW